MRLGVISDTHGHTHFAQEAIRILRNEGVDQILHCGDIGSTEIVSLFDEWPTHFVFGNVDRNVQELTQAIESVDQTCHGMFGELEIEGTNIALLHSHEAWSFNEAVESGEYDLVCYGHTHVAEFHKVHRTMVLNPGALFRANPHSLAIIEIPSMRIESIAL